MAGIYIHIPFCKQRCYYCDFHTSTQLQNKANIISAITKEIEIRKDYLQSEQIKTIYFGGGTPSVLSFNEIEDILSQIYLFYNVLPNAEITFEANPDDLTDSYIAELQKTRINRLSIGVQSFCDNKLILMNRRHNVKEAIESVKKCQIAGFDNISIDLIYGLPEMTLSDWETQVDTALSLNIQHISSYHLTYEKGTVFSHYLKKGKIKALDEDDSFKQFKLLIDKLKSSGFQQYEISNFALYNCFSKHNSNYWKQEKYLGIGPSAHSYNLVSRQWNVSNNTKYFEGIQSGNQVFEIETIDKTIMYNEYLMTSLRTMWGADLNYLKKMCGENKTSSFVKTMHILANQGFAEKTSEGFRLSQAGLFISDKIIADLFVF